MVTVTVLKGFSHPGGAFYPKGSRAAFPDEIAATLFMRGLALREQDWPVLQALTGPDHDKMVRQSVRKHEGYEQRTTQRSPTGRS